MERAIVVLLATLTGCAAPYALPPLPPTHPASAEAAEAPPPPPSHALTEDSSTPALEPPTEPVNQGHEGHRIHQPPPQGEMHEGHVHGGHE